MVSSLAIRSLGSAREERQEEQERVRRNAKERGRIATRLLVRAV